MKTTTNRKELRELNACADGYETFIKAHGDKTVTFSQCLTSNGWDDTWWLISSVYDSMSDQQKIDLRLLGCEYSLSCIDNFESKFPDDKRPRLAIEASQAFAKGEITKEELESAARSARSAARSAAGSAWLAAESAARSAWSARLTARSAEWLAAESAAGSAAESAAGSAAAESVNEKMLMELLIKWES